jgi:hypothetical protein
MNGQGKMASSQASEQSSPSLRERSKDSILFIRALSMDADGSRKKEEKATGFIVTDRGHLLTAGHVLGPETQNRIVEIFAHWGPQVSDGFKLTRIKRDTELDIALFQLPPGPSAWKPLTLASSSAVPDDAELYVLGFPLDQNLASAKGNLSNRFGPQGRFHTTIPLNRGNSGGPVLDIDGRVVGMAIGGLEPAQQITFVVPSDYFSGLIALSGLTIGKTETTAPVYPLFKPIYSAAARRLGSPLAPAQLSVDTYQAAYEHAHVIWVKELLTIFVLPHDSSRKVVRQPEPDWATDPNMFDDDKLRPIFNTPPNRYPPHGGVAYRWQRDPGSWAWIGWRQWYCRSFRETYYQEFENGIVFGTLHLRPTRDEGQLVVVFYDDGSYFTRMSFVPAPKCREISEPFPVL